MWGLAKQPLPGHLHPIMLKCKAQSVGKGLLEPMSTSWEPHNCKLKPSKYEAEPQEDRLARFHAIALGLGDELAGAAALPCRAEQHVSSSGARKILGKIQWEVGENCRLYVNGLSQISSKFVLQNGCYLPFSRCLDKNKF